MCVRRGVSVEPTGTPSSVHRLEYVPHGDASRGFDGFGRYGGILAQFVAATHVDLYSCQWRLTEQE